MQLLLSDEHQYRPARPGCQINSIESVCLAPVFLPSTFPQMTVIIMVKNRTEWADVLASGLEMVPYDGWLLTLLKINIDV